MGNADINEVRAADPDMEKTDRLGGDSQLYRVVYSDGKLRCAPW